MKYFLLLNLLLISVIFPGCKKEEEAVPEPDKLIIWSSHFSANSEGIFAQITQGSRMWTGVISKSNSSVPACFSSDCFTVELEPGTYTIEGVSTAGTYTWPSSTFTITKGSGCNPYKFQ